METQEYRAESPYTRYARPYLDKERIADTPVGVAVFRYEKGQVGPEHQHPQVEVYYTIRGEGSVEFGGRAYEMSPGSIVYIPPNLDHETRNTGDEDLEFIAIFVPPLDFESIKRWEKVS